MIKNLLIYVNLTLHSLAVAACTARFKIKHSTFCPHTVFMWFLRISEKKSNYCLPMEFKLFFYFIYLFIFYTRLKMFTATYKLNFKHKLDCIFVFQGFSFSPQLTICRFSSRIHTPLL